MINDEKNIFDKKENNNFELLNGDVDLEKNIFDEKDENIKDKFQKINKDIINYLDKDDILVLNDTKRRLIPSSIFLVLN